MSNLSRIIRSYPILMGEVIMYENQCKLITNNKCELQCTRDVCACMRGCVLFSYAA